MLQNDLYTIDSLTKEEGSAKAVITLNASHPIFEGHFPGQPVLPGACMLQMIKEVLEIVIGNSLQLQKANQIKFLLVIDPSKDNQLQMQLTYKTGEAIQVSVTILRSEDVCLKFNGVFINIVREKA